MVVTPLACPRRTAATPPARHGLDVAGSCRAGLPAPVGPLTEADARRGRPATVAATETTRGPGAPGWGGGPGGGPPNRLREMPARGVMLHGLPPQDVRCGGSR